MSLVPTLARLPARSLQRVRNRLFVRQRRTWRAAFAQELRGQGLEIGALAHAMAVPPDVRVRYVDRLTVDELRSQYPNLPPQDVRAPDVVDDGGTLKTLPDASEDFLIAAHVFEHLPNPIGALAAWSRVVRPGGLIYLAVPDRRFTFDRHRRRTPLEHLVLDFERPSTERDYEHFLDYALHVHLARTTDDALQEADRLLASGFSIHFHVFEAEDLRPLVGWFSTHVRPLEIVKGPVRPRFTDEFHTLLRVVGR
jgi:predicted SAM-dependent methyltransferase